MGEERILETYEEQIGSAIETKTVLVRNKPFVFTAHKVSMPRKRYKTLLVDLDVGYLLDKEGKLTRDVSQAFVFTLDEIVTRSTWKDRSHEWVERCSEHRIEFVKNGLQISELPLDEAQKWLNNHPLPRKSIGKMTRGQVYNRFNGRCAYCGCELKLEEMQVDHFIPHMSEGGEDTLENYYPACQYCNRVKTDATIDRFRSIIKHCGEIHRKRKKPCMFDSDQIAIKYNLTKEDHKIVFFYETYDDAIKIDVKKLEVIAK